MHACIAWQGMANGESPNDPALGGTRKVAPDPPRTNPSHLISLAPPSHWPHPHHGARVLILPRPSSSASLLLHTLSLPTEPIEHTSSFSRKARVRAKRESGRPGKQTSKWAGGRELTNYTGRCGGSWPEEEEGSSR